MTMIRWVDWAVRAHVCVVPASVYALTWIKGTAWGMRWSVLCCQCGRPISPCENSLVALRRASRHGEICGMVEVREAF
jgi:hypothetical protein